MLQNVFETRCCQEIEKCIQELHLHEVLEDTETPPSCITNHPGFRLNCLEKWTLRLEAPSYKRRDHVNYYQSGTENA